MHAFYLLSPGMDSETFLSTVCSTLQLRVDQLIFANRPVCQIERTSENILREVVDACDGHSALIESDIDTVRFSLRLKSSRDDLLTALVHQLFHTRLSRESIACFRRVAVAGFDVTFIFDYRDRGEVVREMVVDLIDLWRTLEQLVRTRMIIAHRAAGRRLLTHIVVSGKTTLVTTPPLPPVAEEGGISSDTWSTDSVADGPIPDLGELAGMAEEDTTGFLLIN